MFTIDGLPCLPQDQPLGSVLKQEGIKLKVSQFQYEVRVHWSLYILSYINADVMRTYCILEADTN